ncbi:MAG: histidine triad nucleotide-binding protein [Myxococcota bacterium]
MTNCLFCKIAAGQIPSKKAYEDANAYAFHDINPQAPTHILIIPKQHIGSINDVTDAHEGVLGHLFTVARGLAQDQGLADDGYRLVVNTGANAGQTVFHIHMHLIGGRGMGWPPG